MPRKAGTKNKNHIKYVCCICLKDYGCRKYEYELHTKRKKPCKPKNIDNNLDNNLNKDNIEFSNEKVENNEVKYNNNVDNKKNVNIENFLIGEEIISSDNKLMVKLIEKIDNLIKQNEELKDDNQKIKNQLALSNFKPNIKADIKADININVQINNFNNIDYSKIDKKMLINTFMHNTGKQIYLKAIENIYINPECPQNHSIYIADKNRGYVKKYNNGRWETDNLSIIDLLINNFVDYYKLSLEEIKQKPERYERLKNNIKTKMKYLELCDLDYLANLEDMQENDEIDNKKQIKRCKEFREMVYKDMINLLHDKKDIVLSTHKSIV